MKFHDIRIGSCFAAVFVLSAAGIRPTDAGFSLPPATNAQPDVLFREHTRAGRYFGDGILTNGARQKIVEKTTGDIVRIGFNGQFDSNGIDPPGITEFYIRATRGDRNFAAKYFKMVGARKNITAQVIRGNYRYQITTGSSYPFLQEVKPKQRIANRSKTKRFRVTVKDKTSGKSDTAQSIIQKRRD